MLRSFRRIKTVTPSVLKADMHIIGDIVGEGAIEIAGRVNGNIKCLSAKIMSGGAVIGDIIAEKAEIHGEVNGNVTAKAITCGTTAKIIGDIMHQRINIEDGAHVDGSCRKFIPDNAEIKRLTLLTPAAEAEEEIPAIEPEPQDGVKQAS